MRNRAAVLFFCLALTGCSAASTAGRAGRVVNPPAVQQTKPLYGVSFEGRYGFIDETGKLVIRLPPEVYNVRDFTEGLAVIGVRVPHTHGRWGFVDETGKVVIQPRFHNAKPFSEGLAAVIVSHDENTSGQLGFIDKTGAVVIEPQFSVSTGSDYAFSQGLAAVETRDGKWGYIDRTGAMAIKPQFDSALQFSEGLAVVGINRTPYSAEKSYGYIDRNGNWVVRPRFTGGDSFSEGLAAVTEGGKVGYINRQGEMVIKPQFEDGAQCAEELGYERRRDFSEGLAAVQVGGLWGYIDQSGAFVIKPQYACAHRFAEGLAAVGIRTGWNIRIGYIDRAGKLVIKPQFTSAKAFSNGLARVGVGGPDADALVKAIQEAKKSGSEAALERLLEENEEKHGIIDRSGKYVWTPQK